MSTLHAASLSAPCLLQANDGPKKNPAPGKATVPAHTSRSPGDTPALLSLENIHFSYANGHPLLGGANLSLYPGWRLGLSGANGSGKSTLLHLATGLLRPRQGQITFMGKPLAEEKDFHIARPRMGYVLQQSADQLFCATVIEDVAFGPLNLGASAEEAREKAKASLETLGIGHLGERSGHSLSGGEKKMAALATVLSMDPVLLLLDEPTNALDPASHERLLTTLTALDKPFIAVSHDREFLDRVANHQVRLENGLIIPSD